jgi:D-beta-D-heptose 7-phosphate kinase/D-beta-D-heptose 1-phosphate adenosyltransferase
MNTRVVPAPSRLAAILNRLAGRRLVVLGDMVADEHLIGRPARPSREAPIMVLELQQRLILPGGATNLAYNARALGAEVCVCGVIGDDEAGRALRARLDAEGIDTAGLIVSPGRPTSTKTRIWAGGAQQQVQQQVARIDHVDRSEIDAPAKAAILAVLERRLPGVDALLISDYENGVLAQDIIAAALSLARRHGVLITVDSHGDLFRFRGATVATPNQPEAEATTGIRICDDATLREAGRRLLKGMDARLVLITRGSDGMSLFERGGAEAHLPAWHLEDVRDPTGAGDTVAAVFTLALVSGAEPYEAAYLANVAAGLVVRKLGAATTTRDELRQALVAGPRNGRAARTREKLLPRRALAERVRRLRAEGFRVVLTNGCFDILHAGHVAYLQQARELGDVLVVGLNSDASVRALKGPGRPVTDELSRAAILAALECVDYVTIFDEPTASALLEELQPDVYVKGGDYSLETLPEAPVAQRLGCAIHFIPLVGGLSTTAILQRLREGAAGGEPA